MNMIRRETVILIHGTGAGTPSDKAPHWWQTESDFAECLSGHLGLDFEVVAFPGWGGANSEATRRQGAHGLLAFLGRLEEKGQSYHIVAHSHGGSVVWHALQMARPGGAPRFQNLQSWTTVGTPFFTMRPTLDQFWPLAVLFTLALISYLTYRSSSPSADDFRALYYELVAGNVSIIGTLLLGLLAGLLLTILGWSFWRSSRIIWALIGYLKRRPPNSADPLLQKWLGVWHKDDEPINGLLATTGPPQLFTPRPLRGAKSLLLATPAWLFDSCCARPLDELAWSSIMRWLQGADIPGESLTGVSPSPLPATVSWSPLADSISDQMNTSVAGHSGDLAAGIRASFAKIGPIDSEARREYLATLVNWRAILHTSYFNNPDVVKIIAHHITANSNFDSKLAVSEGHDQMAAIFPRRTESGSSAAANQPYRFSRLAIAAIAAVALVGIGLSQSYARLYDLLIRPSTRQAQIDEIGKEIREGILTAAKSSEAAGDVILRYKLLDSDFDTSSTLDNIADASTAMMGLEKLAYAIGRQGLTDQGPRLEAIAELLEDGEGMQAGLGRTAVRFYQWAGTVDNNTVSDAVPPPAVGEMKTLVENASSLVPVAASYYTRAGYKQVAVELISTAEGDCSKIEGLAEFEALKDALAEKFPDCPKPINKRPVDNLRQALHFAKNDREDEALKALLEFTGAERETVDHHSQLLLLELLALKPDGGRLKQPILAYWQKLIDQKRLTFAFSQEREDFYRDAGILARIAIAFGKEERVEASADANMKKAEELEGQDGEEDQSQIDELLDAAAKYEALGKDEKLLAAVRRLVPALRAVEKPDATTFAQSMALSLIAEKVDLDASVAALRYAERAANINPLDGRLELTQLAKRLAEMKLYSWAMRCARRAGSSADGQRNPWPGIVQEGTLGGYAAILDAAIRATDEKAYLTLGLGDGGYPVAYADWPAVDGIFLGVISTSDE